MASLRQTLRPCAQRTELRRLLELMRLHARQHLGLAVVQIDTVLYTRQDRDAMSDRRRVEERGAGLLRLQYTLAWGWAARTSGYHKWRSINLC
jgi:hypothetical protein